MRLISKILLGFSLALLITSCKKVPKVTVHFNKVQTYVSEAMNEAYQLTDSLKSLVNKPDLLQKTFLQARLAYKKAEPFATVYNSDAAHSVNGPPLPVFREDNGKVLPSIGFQAIGEMVYDPVIDSFNLVTKIDITLGYLELLLKSSQKTEITPRRYFLPMHQQLLRIFTLGLTGFDTPTSLAGINESARALENFKELYLLAIGDTIQSIDRKLHEQLLVSIDQSVEYIDRQLDFDAFDRYTFARKYLNPITSLWVQARKISGLWEDPKIYALNLDAPTFFESNSFNIRFFRTSYNADPSESQIALGKRLFFDKDLSEGGKLACSTCHDPAKSYQDGLTKGQDKDGNQLGRNTPTIINSVYQKKFFWDGRSDNLEQQINAVFNNDKEFNLAGHEISAIILDSEDYQKSFSDAYPDQKINKNKIIRALASYVSTLTAMNSKFDKNMRGELDNFTKEEIKGMNLFMGKALCATCHFIPLTNGTVPPLFKETEKEILGTPKSADNKELDEDLGFYWVYEQEIHKYMFKTPTIRNISSTGPYMHNGIYETLEEVMDFYNKGGGAGLGFDLEYQTLPFDSLGLADDEQAAIISFMKTFTDQNY